MKLSEYLAREGINAAEFAKRIGVKRQHGWRLAKGISLPSGRVAAAIERETGGAVGFRDFFDAGQPEKAAA